MLALATLAGGFATGIFARSVVGVGWPFAAFTLILAAIIGGAALLGPRRAYIFAALFLICAVLGGARAFLAEGGPPPSFHTDLRKRVSYEGVVVGDPDLRDSSERIPVRVTRGTAHTTMLAVVPRTVHTGVGDTVRVSGTLLPPEPFATDGGRVFAYDKYLARQGIYYLLDYGSLYVVRPAPWYAPGAALARMKHWFLGGLARALPEPYAALAGGIVIGGKSGLGSDLQGAFTKSGLVHVIVLSGYNVMVVAEWVLIFFTLLSAYTPLPRRSGFAAGALALVLFVGVAGASASAVRAALMALIALYARATSRTYVASRALLLVALAMLVWNPSSLAFDPGWGLSVAATGGLIWLSPLVERRFSFIKSTFWREAVGITLAAQIAVLPLILYETGNISLYGLPANLLVMPFMPLAMAAAALAGLGGALLAPVAGILGMPAYLLTYYFITIARAATALPGAGLSIPAFPFVFVLAAYAALALIAASKRRSTTLQLRLAKKASI